MGEKTAAGAVWMQAERADVNGLPVQVAADKCGEVPEPLLRQASVCDIDGSGKVSNNTVGISPRWFHVCVKLPVHKRNQRDDAPLPFFGFLAEDHADDCLVKALQATHMLHQHTLGIHPCPDPS
mmetsp:Transcript_26410/g.51176  ORF Transcript_26410/g.51176 Transcript_26410/m.51176 type:complete len:124 (-) Transcript_26410:519-890(-)